METFFNGPESQFPDLDIPETDYNNIFHVLNHLEQLMMSENFPLRKKLLQEPKKIVKMTGTQYHKYMSILSKTEKIISLRQLFDTPKKLRFFKQELRKKIYIISKTHSYKIRLYKNDLSIIQIYVFEICPV